MKSVELVLVFHEDNKHELFSGKQDQNFIVDVHVLCYWARPVQDM